MIVWHLTWLDPDGLAKVSLLGPAVPLQEEKCIYTCPLKSGQCGAQDTPATSFVQSLSGGIPYPLKPQPPESNHSGGLVHYVVSQTTFLVLSPG